MYLFNTKMANGWRHIATVFYGVADPQYPPPRHLVREISRYCPGFCVVWCLKVYRTPAGSEIRRGFHVLCRYIATPRHDMEPIALDNVSRDFPYPARAIYESRILERNVPEHSIYRAMGIPGYPAYYAPFSEWWLPQLRRMWWETRRRDQRRMEKTARAHAQAEQQKREAPLKRADDDLRMRLRSRRAAIRQAILDDLEGKPAPPQPSLGRVYSKPPLLPAALRHFDHTQPIGIAVGGGAS